MTRVNFDEERVRLAAQGIALALSEYIRDVHHFIKTRDSDLMPNFDRLSLSIEHSLNLTIGQMDRAQQIFDNDNIAGGPTSGK